MLSCSGPLFEFIIPLATWQPPVWHRLPAALLRTVFQMPCCAPHERLVPGFNWRTSLCASHGKNSLLLGCRVRLTHRLRIGQVPVQQLNPTNPSDFSFRAFQGRGRRLAD